MKAPRIGLPAGGGAAARRGADAASTRRREQDPKRFTPGQAVVGHAVPPVAQYKPSRARENDV